MISSTKTQKSIFLKTFVAIFLVLFLSLVSAACIPFNTVCRSDGNPYVCNWNGLSETKLDTCTSSQKCFDPFSASIGAECMNLKCESSTGTIYYYRENGDKSDTYKSCGTGTTTGANYCSSSKDVVRDQTTNGCSGSSCTSVTNTQSVAACNAGTTYGSNYCSSGNVVRDKTVKGCSSGSCTSSTSTETVSNCNAGTTYGSNYCSGNTVVRDKTVKGCSGSSCSSSTSTETVKTCGTYEQCNAGSCVAKTCQELGYLDSCVLLTNTICSSNNAYQCQSTPSGKWCYVKTETCGVGEYCADPSSPTIGAQCFTLGCSNNDVYYYFKTDGTKSDLKEDCGSLNCSNGACIAPICSPSNSRCVSNDTHKMEVCSSDGSIWDTELSSWFCLTNTSTSASWVQCLTTSDCLGTEYCSNNSCLMRKADGENCSTPNSSTTECASLNCNSEGKCGPEKICTPGNKKCKFLEPHVMETCNSSGTAWDGTSSSRYCLAGALNTASWVDCLQDSHCSSAQVCTDNTCVAAPCVIDSVSWSKTSAVQWDTVTMNVSTTNCNGKEITFSIFEDDGLILPADYIMDINVSILNETGSYSWVVPYIEDQIGGPEYYFKAKYSTQTKQSELLKVAMGLVTDKTFDKLDAAIGSNQITIITYDNVSGQASTFLDSLKIVVQNKTGKVPRVISSSQVSQTSCWDYANYNTTLILIGNITNNKAINCITAVNRANPIAEQQMNLVNNPWASGKYAIIVQGDNTYYDAIAALKIMVEKGASSKLTMSDNIIGCLWTGDMTLGSEITCNVLPIVELIPDVRDSYNCAKNKFIGLFSSTTPDDDTLINQIVCGLTYFATGYDFVGYAGAVFSAGYAEGPIELTDASIVTIKISLKNALKGLERKIIEDAYSTFKLIPGSGRVIFRIEKELGDFSEGVNKAIVKIFANGKDAAENGLKFAKSSTSIMNELEAAGILSKTDSLDGIASLFKIQKNNAIKITIDCVDSGATKSLIKMASGEKLYAKVNSVITSLELPASNLKEIKFVDDLGGELGIYDKQLNTIFIQTKNPFKGIPGSQITDEKYESIILNHVLPHEFAHSKLKGVFDDTGVGKGVEEFANDYLLRSKLSGSALASYNTETEFLLTNGEYYSKFGGGEINSVFADYASATERNLIEAKEIIEADFVKYMKEVKGFSDAGVARNLDAFKTKSFEFITKGKKAVDEGIWLPPTEWVFLPDIIPDCYSDSDCGTNSYVGNAFCSANDVFGTFRTFTCNNPGTASAVCVFADNNQLKTDCSVGQICNNASCLTPVCSSDLSCNDNNVNTQDVCLNPGTISSACTYNSIRCINDSQCNDNNSLTIDSCLNPATISSSCTNVPLSLGCVSFSKINGASVLCNCTDLQNVSNNLSGSYVLGQDINCSETKNWNSGAGFNPIGSSNQGFTGTFDGNKKIISDLYINKPSAKQVGLFVYTFRSTIRDIGLVNVNIIGGTQVGAITGFFVGSINNSYSTGKINGIDQVGGLVGWNGGTISDSYSTANIRGINNVGGLAGYSMYGGCAINNSYSTGNVIATGDNAGGLMGAFNGCKINDSFSLGSVIGKNNVGGLVGFSGVYGSMDGSLINNSYSTGGVNGVSNVGGLVGNLDYYFKVNNSYSVGKVIGNANFGGLVGYSPWKTVTNSFWDINSSGQMISAGGIGKTTSEMKSKLSFSDWDFNNNWKESNNSYPVLSWQQELVPLAVPILALDARNDEVNSSTTVLSLNSNQSEVDCPIGQICGDEINDVSSNGSSGSSGSGSSGGSSGSGAPFLVSIPAMDENKAVKIDENVSVDKSKIVQLDSSSNSQPSIAKEMVVPSLSIKEINDKTSLGPTAFFGLDTTSSISLGVIIILVLLIIVTSSYIIKINTTN